MKKGFFVVGTDTDVGKTYVTAVLARAMKEAGMNVGYYKAALSGAYKEGDALIPGDAKEVLEAGGIEETYEGCVSYIYEEAISPHLAARRSGKPMTLAKVAVDYEVMRDKYEYLLVEGSGGIVCPLKLEDDEVILLEDVIKLTKLPIILIARAGLGTINHTVLTVHYIKSLGIPIEGVILNQYEHENFMHIDNKETIERLTQVPVLGVISEGGEGGEIIERLC